MKRIIVLSEKGERLFYGNLCDIPFDESEVLRDAIAKYGENVCPQRYASVKQALISSVFDTGEDEMIIPESAKRLLRDKHSYKIQFLH